MRKTTIESTKQSLLSAPFFAKCRMAPWRHIPEGGGADVSFNTPPVPLRGTLRGETAA